MIRECWELFQQVTLGFAQPTAGFDQIWPDRDRAMEGLSGLPPGDQGMIPAAQDLRHAMATIGRRTGELGFFDQAVSTKTLIDRACSIAHRSRQEATHRFDDQTGSDLTPIEDHITNADLTVNQVLTHPIIDAFVAAADQGKPVTISQFVGQILVKPATSRTQEVERSRWIDSIDGVKQGLGLHHHARSPTKGRVVNASVDIGGLVARIVDPQVDDPALAGLAE